MTRKRKIPTPLLLSTFFLLILVSVVSSTTTISDLGIITPDLNITGDVRIFGKLTGASPLSMGHEGIQFSNETDDIHYSIYHAVGDFSESFINVSPDFTGAMIFQSEHLTQNNGMDVCFWDKQKQKMLFCINDFNTSRATTIRDSFQIVGATTLDDENFTVCAGANFIDCNTTLTGADLFVDDDIEAQSIYANENMNITGNLAVDTNTLFVNSANNRVGIRTVSPTASLEVVGDNPGNVGGFPSGALQVKSALTDINSNAVITGHSSFGGNKQLWYVGSTSSSNDNIAFINRQNAELHFHTNDLNRLTIQAGGNVGIGETNPSEKLEVNGDIKLGTVIDKTAYAQLSSSVDQNPGNTSPTVITYNTQDAISGITHSTSVNPGEITIGVAGIYFVSPQPQVGKTTGASKTDFDMFLQVNRGSGFVDEPNSNVKIVIKDSDITDVIVSAFTISLDEGDKIRMMQRISSSSVGLGLKNTDPETGPPTVPRTPSIIFTMYRVGGI